MSANPYLSPLQAAKNRLLNLYDTDPFSPTYGLGDRDYWGWKVKDFANGTYQGGVHGLAAMWKLDLLENREFVFPLIDAVMQAIPKVSATNGSVVESYPNEHSFCVSALVALDALRAIELLDDELESGVRSSYLEIIAPLIGFITRHGEEHAIISNHLATGVAAVALWKHLSGETSHRDAELLQIIYDHQSPEGWYREYEGADPGYQTLCTYYLAIAYRLSGDEKLLESLRRSAEFLMHFVHPDGTIGGLYGSRNTEVYYPGGIVALSGKISEFALMAQYLEPRGQHITPDMIDHGNLIPLFNSYALAALEYDTSRLAIEKCERQPFFHMPGERQFDDAGIYLHSTSKYFAIVNYHKGGTLKVFDREETRLDTEDGGIFGELESGERFATQMADETQHFQEQIVRTGFYRLGDSRPGPLNFMILRLLGLSVFRSVTLGNLFKKFIVKLLMTRKKRIDGEAVRRFVFEENQIMIKERITPPKKCVKIGHFGKTKAIHMASSGYYHPQTEQLVRESKFVTFRSEP